VKLILVQDVKSLGKKGAVVDVSDGYARNFLLPRKLALMATEGNLRALDSEKKMQQEKQKRELTHARKTAEDLGKTVLRLKAKSGEGGKLFGSVTSHDIEELVKREMGIEIDRRRIEMKEPIKRTGLHKVPLRLFQGVTVEMNIEVVPEES
jgi:large subunit ribosomal protein L9